MCHQIVQIFECGHNNGSKVFKCEKPTDECNEIFLKQELEDIPRPCASCHKKEGCHKASKAQTKARDDEEYWSQLMAWGLDYGDLA